MHRRILLLILFGLYTGHLVAQQKTGMTVRAISSLSTGTGKYYYANRNEPPRAIEFIDNKVTPSQFLAKINQYLNISGEFSFKEVESNIDKLGMVHHLLQQYYQGIPLEGMLYRVHEKNGFVTSVNGRAVRNVSLDSQITIGEIQAFQLALKYLQTKDTTIRVGRKLIVSKGFTFTPESFAVAFQFDINVSLIERWRISIDARNGEVLNKVSLVNSCFNEPAPPLPYGTGTGLTNYYGQKTIRVEKFGEGSRLMGETEHGGKIRTYDFKHGPLIVLIFGFPYNVSEFYSANNTYNHAYHKPAVSVQWAAEHAFEYYFKKHNRNSFDNNGTAITSYVHVDRDLDNAFWTGKLMAFGDGSNNNPLVELDVVSHELTHGVTQYEAELQYSYEPGALNESFSDIFAKAVEFDLFGDTATWQLAKHYRDGGLRDFSNPNLKNQPDTYAGDLWVTGYEDYGGVHSNSGVQNFWFYLLCEGGSGVNDHQVAFEVESIGMERAADITYRNLTEYLSYFSDYLDSRIGSLLATADLYGKSSTVYTQVSNAWDAVGVVDEPIITSLELYDITATTVKIKGSLIPRADVANYRFEYGPTPDYGSSSSIYPYADKIEGMLSDLRSETKYYLRLVATNENGRSYAYTEFTTISLAPLAKIRQTVDVTETTATLHGQINPNSLFTSFYFEYGVTPALGLVTPTYPLSNVTEFVNVSAPVHDLMPRQKYYYRLVALNDFASTTTGSATFFTAVKPVILAYSPAAAPIGAEVSIVGKNFNPATEKNFVSFGATRAHILSSSSTEIIAKVPAGASLAPISLLDSESGLIAESVQEFVPTHTAGYKKRIMRRTIGTTDYIYQTLVQDMDGDGKPDIVARNYLGFSVFQNVNQGGDVTEESFIRSSFPLEQTPGILSLVDFDGNGLKDIVGRYQNKLRIYPNLSVPGYIFFGMPVDLTVGNLGNVVYSDFDMDGHIDIAGTGYTSQDSSTFVIIRNQNPKGLISADNFERRYSGFLPNYIRHLSAEDLNNDGRAELLPGIYRSQSIPVLKNNSEAGVFSFEANTLGQHTQTESYPEYFPQDLNQDGWKDIAAYLQNDNETLAILENKRTSPVMNFASPMVLLEALEPVFQPGDIDGDGKVDLVVGLNEGRFLFLKNNTSANEPITASSFEEFEEYGEANNSISDQSSMTVNDLNGDGRPEIINTYYHSQWPLQGYMMEVWQNSPTNCPDPSLITVQVSNNTATIVLPPNTNLDQFEIEYKNLNSTWWNYAHSTTLQLARGYQYQLRARAKCYLGYTDYHYIDFTTDCVDTESFSISSIEINSVTINVYDVGSFEIQYSRAGDNLWKTVPQYNSLISDLLPGTSYDLRFRGRCYNSSEFQYRQFTTLCPQLSNLAVTDVTHKQARVTWTSNYGGNAILEYSADNVEWTLIDGTGTISLLTPAREYFVRGRIACTDISSDFLYASFFTKCPQLSMLYANNVTPFGAIINWEDPTNSGNYTLTYSAMAGPVTIVETNTRSFTLDNLSPGTLYKVAVAPQCVLDQEFSTTTFQTVCYAPYNLFATVTSQTTAELSWADHFSGVPYAIDYSILGSNVWVTVETPFTNLSLDELRPGTAYEARVHIHCVNEKARDVSVRFDTRFYEEFKFGPNPTRSQITLQPSKNLIGNRFSIHDNAGRQMANGELRDYTLDLSNFAVGMYILRISGEKPVRIVKY